MMRFSIILFAIFFFFNSTFAKSEISGKVSDSTLAETIIGASVTLKDAKTNEVISGTITDFNGNFVFEIAPGNYNLEIKSLGFEDKNYTDLNLEEGKLIQIRALLSAKQKNQLNEVVITATRKQETINSIYTMQKNARSVSDGISADIIKRSPDKNTGEVLKRLSGTTIQDNKFVIVRGLSDRYNAALVDNSPMPSTEPNKKAFSFDIIPSSLIDNIIITKSATPDLPGDFSGGLIHIQTKEIPDENFNTISIGAGINTVSTFNAFQSGKRGSLDFLGFADAKRQLPKNFPTQTEIMKLNPYKPESSTPYLKELNNNFSIREHTALPSISLQGTLGRVYNLNGNAQFGITGALNYNHDEHIKKDLLRQYDNYDYRDNVYNYSSNLGMLLNLGYRNNHGKINLKTFYNRILNDQLLNREGENYSSSSRIKYYAFDLVQKSLFKTSLNAEHKLGKGNAVLDWVASYNLITNNQPDQRKVSYSEMIGGNNDYAADITTLGKSNNRLFGNLNESIWNGALNIQKPISLFHETTIKAGFFGQYRIRDFENRYIGATLSPNNTDAEFIRQLPVGSLFDDNILNQNVYILEEQTGDLDNYHAEVSTLGGYAMMDNKITDKLRAVWGARLESYHVSIASKEKEIVDQQYLDILPSLNLTYSLSDKANLRAAYFRSIARPELRELTNVSYYDYELSATMNGNPNLKRTQIDNIDLRYEFFPRSGEVISFSLFYKQFHNAIENFVYGANSSYDITPSNSLSAMNMGAEFEIRKNLSFISANGFFKNTSAYINMAYIYSKADADNLYIRGEKINSRPLSGQAPYVFNTGLSYFSNDGKLNLNVLYNRIGQRLTFIGQDKMGIIYESPRNLLDFQISYKVSKRSEFRLNIKDILNDPVRFYFDQNNDMQYNGTAFINGNIEEGKDWIWQTYRPGSSFSLSYSYQF